MCKVVHTKCQQTWKQKKENWTGEEDAVLLEEAEKSKPYLFETAPTHRDTDDFERPWTLEAASCQIVSWTIGCIAYVRWVVLCMSGAMVSNKSNVQTKFPTEVVLGNKFLIAKAS